MATFDCDHTATGERNTAAVKLGRTFGLVFVCGSINSMQRAKRRAKVKQCEDMGRSEGAERD